MFRARIGFPPLLLLLLLALSALPAAAQVCTDPGAYCEGWSRDSTRRELDLSRTTICQIGLTLCPATCSTSPITALPSIRIGNLNHAVLGFSVTDACQPECAGAIAAEPCYNLGVSYRRKLAGGSESVSGVYDCDPSDPGTTVAAGASFTGDYATGGTETVTISNIVYGSLPPPDNCGSAPTSLDLNATGPNMAVQSHFTFLWDAFNKVAAYTETRTYFTLPGPNTVHISVSNINYGAGTFTASVPDASTPVRSSTWGQLKVRYR